MGNQETGQLEAKPMPLTAGQTLALSVLCAHTDPGQFAPLMTIYQDGCGAFVTTRRSVCPIPIGMDVDTFKGLLEEISELELAEEKEGSWAPTEAGVERFYEGVQPHLKRMRVRWHREAVARHMGTDPKAPESKTMRRYRGRTIISDKRAEREGQQGAVLIAACALEALKERGDWDGSQVTISFGSDASVVMRRTEAETTVIDVFDIEPKTHKERRHGTYETEYPWRPERPLGQWL